MWLAHKVEGIILGNGGLDSDSQVHLVFKIAARRNWYERGYENTDTAYQDAYPHAGVNWVGLADGSGALYVMATRSARSAAQCAF